MAARAHLRLMEDLGIKTTAELIQYAVKKNLVS